MNIFIDCGFYNGTIISTYLRKGIIDDTWTIYAFEPNPVLEIKEYLKNIPLDIKVSKKAVWIDGSMLTFHVSNAHNGSHLEGTTSSYSIQEFKVRGFDFSKFVADLPKDANIICSMDIEGAEYPVLEKMLEEGTAKRIKVLDIEFHHRMMGSRTATDSRRIIRKFRALGTSVKLKVPLQ